MQGLGKVKEIHRISEKARIAVTRAFYCSQTQVSEEPTPNGTTCLLG